MFPNCSGLKNNAIGVWGSWDPPVHLCRVQTIVPKGHYLGEVPMKNRTMKGHSCSCGSIIMGIRMISFPINSPIALSPSIFPYVTVPVLLSHISFYFSFYCKWSLSAFMLDSITFVETERSKVWTGEVLVTSSLTQEYSQVAGADSKGLGSTLKDRSSGLAPKSRIFDKWLLSNANPSSRPLLVFWLLGLVGKIGGSAVYICTGNYAIMPLFQIIFGRL